MLVAWQVIFKPPCSFPLGKWERSPPGNGEMFCFPGSTKSNSFVRAAATEASGSEFPRFCWGCDDDDTLYNYIIVWCRRKNPFYADVRWFRTVRALQWCNVTDQKCGNPNLHFASLGQCVASNEEKSGSQQKTDLSLSCEVMRFRGRVGGVWSGPAACSFQAGWVHVSVGSGAAGQPPRAGQRGPLCSNPGMPAQVDAAALILGSA